MKVSKLLAPIAVVASISLLVISSSSSRPGGTASPGSGPDDKPLDVQGDGEKYDVDFTKMSLTMQVSHSYRILAKPEEFDGMRMRLSGVFLSYADDKTGKRYFGCMLGNGAGCSCCSVGVLDIAPRNASSWPTNFPPIETFITVTGRLRMQEVSDGKNTYNVPVLADAEVSPK